MPCPPDELSLDELRLVDRLAVAFERSLQNHETVSIADILSGVPESVRHALFAELLALELAHLKRQGITPSWSDYLDRFPHDGEAIEDIFKELGLRAAASSLQQSVDGYLIQRRLARGGMGIVYQAIDQQLGRIVALKMLSSDSMDAEQLRRFQAESRALASLDHPNILKIYAVGYWHDQPYLVLEFAADGTLADRLRQGPMAPGDALELMATLTEAVAFLHEHTLVHRDLKPSNILFTEQARLKVGDFGLVHNLIDDADLTQSGETLGTPAYMAPEQLNADVGSISPATDVFALGVIFHHLLTGQVPYQGLTAGEMLSAIPSRQPVPLQALTAHGIMPDFVRVCRRCLQKNPAHRYTTAGQLLADIQRLQQGRSVSSLPLHWQRLVSRSRQLAAAAVLVLFGGAISAGLIWTNGSIPAGYLGSEVIGHLPDSVLRSLESGGDAEAINVPLLGAAAAPEVALSAPLGLAIHDDRYLAVADSLNHRILIVDLQTGAISRLAGNGDASYAGDGNLAIQSTLNVPTGLQFDELGQLYVADRRNHAIRRIDRQGVISTLTGIDGCGEDAESSSRPYLCHPLDVALANNGDYFIADSGRQRIRYQQPNAVMSSALDRSGQPSQLFPRAIEFAGDELYLLDAAAGALMAMTYDGDQRVVAAGFHQPLALAADGRGNIYVGDASSQSLSRVNVTTATVESVSTPVVVDALTVDSRGRIYIASRDDNSVHVVLPDDETALVAMQPRDLDSRPASPVAIAGRAHLEREFPFSYVDYTYGLLLVDLTARLGLELWMAPDFDVDSRIDMTNYPLSGKDMLAVSCALIRADCALDGRWLKAVPGSSAGLPFDAERLTLPAANQLIENGDVMPKPWQDALLSVLDFSHFTGDTFAEFLLFVEDRTPLAFDIDASADGFRQARYRPEREYAVSDLLTSMMLARKMQFTFDPETQRLRASFAPARE